MTTAQKERIAADFVVAFINKGRITSNKEAVKSFHRIHELLSATQDGVLKSGAKKTTATKKSSKIKTEATT